jgi:hypothetical protein
MKPLYTQEEFDISKSKDLLPCECYQCGGTFYLTRHRIKNVLNPILNDQGRFCNIKCSTEFSKKRTLVKCLVCNKETLKNDCNIKKNKNTFCSHSCNSIYQNNNKTWGTNRSKLEVWIEEQLKKLKPNLEIHFNSNKEIKAELDIFIPSLNLAFEINGIFHYEPIFGDEKLKKTKYNDENKFKKCHQKNISLCIINTSSENSFKIKNSQKYLDIILDIINDNIL